MLYKIVLSALLARVAAVPFPQNDIEFVPQLVVNVAGTINGSMNGTFTIDDPFYQTLSTSMTMPTMASQTLSLFVTPNSTATLSSNITLSTQTDGVSASMSSNVTLASPSITSSLIELVSTNISLPTNLIGSVVTGDMTSATVFSSNVESSIALGTSMNLITMPTASLPGTITSSIAIAIPTSMNATKIPLKSANATITKSATTDTTLAAATSTAESSSFTSFSASTQSAFLSPIRLFLTSRDLSQNALTESQSIQWTNLTSGPVVKFNGKSYQTIQGFGASMTESSAYLISQLPNNTQSDVMTKLFDKKDGIGLNFLRQPIGGSDLALPYHFYTYSNTKPVTSNAKSLASAFSVQVDSQYILPLLKDAFSINPDISILGTPWSPPSWMREGNNVNGTEGGNLQSQYYDAYAQYFVDYANQYAQQGLPIWAVTVQNEPLYAPFGYPGMSFSATEASDFISNSLIPAMKGANLSTKVLVYDHNWDHPEYPVQVLHSANMTPSSFQGENDSPIAGVAWHCYADDPTGAQNMLQQAYPGVGQYLTECSGGTWEGSTTDAFETWIGTAISTMQNYGSALVRWGMALDNNGQPNLSTGAACSTCRGVIGIPDINKASTVQKEDVLYNSDYYILGHFSKFIQKGAVRIGTSDSGTAVSHVEFRNPDGSVVMVVYNGNAKQQTFTLQYQDSSTLVKIPAYTAATLTWF